MTDEDLEILDGAEEATVEHPNAPAVWLRYGRLLFEPAHRNGEATEALNHALRLAPRSVEARFWQATVHEDDFDYATARGLLEQALEIDPSNPECLSLLAYVLREFPVPRMERVALLRCAIESAPTWRSPRQLLVTEFAEAGDSEAAIRELAIIDQLPVTATPTDPADDYYEKVVTGRAGAPLDIWRDEIDRLLRTGPG